MRAASTLAAQWLEEDPNVIARWEGKLIMLPDLPGCWLWIAGLSADGYGVFHVRLNGRHRQEPAHRFSYRMFSGELADDLNALHSCDVRPCVRPSHLSPGTQGKNIRDAMARHRLAIGIRNGNAKISCEQAAEIRRLVAGARRGVQTIVARRFGVSSSLVSKINRGYYHREENIR